MVGWAGLAAASVNEKVVDKYGLEDDERTTTPGSMGKSGARERGRELAWLGLLACMPALAAWVTARNGRGGARHGIAHGDE